MNEQRPDDASMNDLEVSTSRENVDEASVDEASVDEASVDEASVDENNFQVETQMQRMSRRSFLWGAFAVGAGYGGLRWMNSRRADDGVMWPLRRGLQWNEEIARDTFDPNKLAPEFPANRARAIRVNGRIGFEENFDPRTWKLRVEGLAAGDKDFTLAQIQALPRATMTTELKCIEGWATVVTWSGARLRDFLIQYPPATLSGNALDLKKNPDDLPAFIGLETPGAGYYVGLEREIALHPQTLLCYEMNGQPLTLEHGAPLRLVTPLKYGIKSLKRIGTLRFVDERPADYWVEHGYDYHAGH